VSGPKDEQREKAERELFREAMRGVRALAAPATVPAVRRPVRARARFARAERSAVLAASLAAPDVSLDLLPGDALQFRQPGVPERVLRGLRRGSYRLDGELDLHGLNLEQGREQLRGFLQSALAQRWRCVRIVHGKGLRSGTRGPVLKHAVNALLRRTDRVLAFTSAGLHAGGSGATLVLLKVSA